jgi:hypothetical protein
MQAVLICDNFATEKIFLELFGLRTKWLKGNQTGKIGKGEKTQII